MSAQDEEKFTTDVIDGLMLLIRAGQVAVLTVVILGLAYALAAFLEITT